MFDRDDRVRPKAQEACPASRINLQPDPLPVSKTGRRGHGIMQKSRQLGICIGKLTQKEVLDNTGFYPKLLFIIAMLEITAAALSIPGAGRLDSCRMGLFDHVRIGIQRVVSISGDGDGHCFAGQHIPDEDSSSIVEPAKAEAAMHDLFDPDRLVRVLQTCFSGDFS
jgi:hypothetical protein